MTVDGVRIVIEQGRSGAFFATSPDMRGLQVAAMTMDGLIAELPEAIAQMKAAAEARRN